VSDDEFAAAVERRQTPNTEFHHRDHLRLTWIYLRRFGPDEAPAAIAAAIRRFAAHHGQAERYHETMTIAWVRLVASAGGETFEEALTVMPELLDKQALRSYYSAAVLDCDAARRDFLAPDLAPLP